MKCSSIATEHTADLPPTNQPPTAANPPANQPPTAVNSTPDPLSEITKARRKGI